MSGLTWVELLVLVNGWICLGCLEKERIALLQLKASINYPNVHSLKSWVEEKGTPLDCCVGSELSAATPPGVWSSSVLITQENLGL